jgi:molybdopterin/thiamine biosynthesis adenylyltransferase/rhodanese-related sulfurtransferase
MSEIQNKVEFLRTSIRQVEPGDLDSICPDLLLDCREKEEVESGLIPSAIWIPKGQVDLKIEERFSDKNQAIVVYCAAGTRSLLVSDTLMGLGYKNVQSLRGGIQAWKSEGRPLQDFGHDFALNKNRYLSQLRVPEIGEAGQIALAKARVLIVGAGGLGSPLAYYLTAAGVGEIGIIDPDVVDESNLQRQILHTTDRIGLKKVDSAFITLRALNPEVKVTTHANRLDAENVDDLLSSYDLIMDSCDNFDTRYLINMASVKHGKPSVHGSVLRFQGQVSVFDGRQGPCYSCMYPSPPTPDLEIDCASGGVLGAVVGVVGTLMAVETIKLILHKGRSLSGRLLSFDGLESEFEVLRIKRNPSCRVCAQETVNLSYAELKSYLKTCRLKED